MGIGRDIAYGLGAAATAPLWAASLLRTGKWKTDWPARLGRHPHPPYPPTPAHDAADGRGGGSHRPRRLLLYGVSVGEVNAIRALVRVLADRPGLEVVIAAATDTGLARAEALYGDRHRVVRFPYDFSFAVRGFLHAVAVDAVGLVELEVWPNFMEACEARGIPVAVINGRLSARSHRRYRKVRRLVSPSFARLAKAAVQTEDYARRFIDLGVPEDRVVVTDSMKWDNTQVREPTAWGEKVLPPAAAALGSAMGINPDKPLIVAGSTAPGEERLLLERRPAGTQVMIVPRKPEWFDTVAKAMARFGAVRRRSESAGGGGEAQRFRDTDAEGDANAEAPTELFLLDSMGELGLAYAWADVAVVGRSFLGNLHGSDMMEPVAMGRPTVIGPFHSDFAEAGTALADAGGLVVSGDPLGAALELLHNPKLSAEVAAAGQGVILSRQGATRRTAALLAELLQLAPVVGPELGSAPAPKPEPPAGRGPGVDPRPTT